MQPTIRRNWGWVLKCPLCSRTATIDNDSLAAKPPEGWKRCCGSFMKLDAISPRIVEDR